MESVKSNPIEETLPLLNENNQTYEPTNKSEETQTQEKVENMQTFECLICYEEYLVSIVTLNCKHKFHYSCLSNWDKIRRDKFKRDTSIYLECPNCMDSREIIMIDYDIEEPPSEKKQALPKIETNPELGCCTIL